MRNKENGMYEELEKWLDGILSQEMQPEIIALGFNLYEDGNNRWSMEAVGTGSFDLEDEDWMCDEITDFRTRENPFVWEKEADWSQVLEEVISLIKEYLNRGTYSNIFKGYAGAGAGFVDGEIEILYSM